MKTGYLQVSNKSYISNRTYKLLPQSRVIGASHIDVPIYLWDYGTKTEFSSIYAREDAFGDWSEHETKLELVNKLQLNGVVVDFVSGYGDPTISWIVDGVPYHLSINMQASSSMRVSGKVSYILRFWQDTVYGTQAVVKRVPTDVDNFFNFPNLRAVISFFTGAESFQYGLLPRKFNILYNGYTFDSAYVFFLGTWALILKDDMSLDSIVALSGKRKSGITVGSVFYTKNLRLLKASTMMG